MNAAGQTGHEPMHQVAGDRRIEIVGDPRHTRAKPLSPVEILSWRTTGGGKAVESIESIAQTFNLKKVPDSILVKGRPEGQAVCDLKSLGAHIAASSGK